MCIVFCSAQKKKHSIEIYRKRKIAALSIDGVKIFENKLLNFDLVNALYET
jgi:hypothetical protein